MDVLKGMTIFVEVAKQQGFAPAARALNMSTSAVSRYVIDLENWFGVQLLRRTTRHLHLTEHGKIYLSQCQHIVGEVANIRRSSKAQQEEPQGRLRITAPVFIAKHFLQELLPEYLNKYSRIELDLVVVDRYVNIVEEGFDLAIRVGVLEDSSFIARKLADVSLMLVATPTYIKQHGMPKSISDLKNLNCLIDTVPHYADGWPIADKKTGRRFRACGNIRINSGEIIRSMALASAGIALLPDFFVEKDVQEGNLISILESKVHFNAGLFAIYPNTKHLSVNVPSFINFLIAHIDSLRPSVVKGIHISNGCSANA